MSYNGRQGSGYGNQQRHGSHGSFGSKKKKKQEPPPGFSQRDMRLAEAAFSGRSSRSQDTDLAKEAPKAENLEMWLHSPASLDIPGIDSPLSMNPKERQQQVKAIAETASKRVVEIQVKSSTKQGQKIKRFRVVPKAKAKAETEKALKEIEKKTETEIKELAKVDAPKAKEIASHLPSQEEIYAEAVKMWQLENNKGVHEGFMENVANPTRGELQEEGLLNQAKLRLMTSQDTVASRQTMDYVENIRNELQKIGFDVVPISGFDVSDLKF